MPATDAYLVALETSDSLKQWLFIITEKVPGTLYISAGLKSRSRMSTKEPRCRCDPVLLSKAQVAAGHSLKIHEQITFVEGMRLSCLGLDISFCAGGKVWQDRMPHGALTGLTGGGDSAYVTSMGEDQWVRTWNSADGAMLSSFRTPALLGEPLQVGSQAYH